MNRKIKYLTKHLFRERAQVSIEMIVLLAAVIALVLLIVSRLQASGTKAADAFDGKMKDVFKEIDKI